MRIYAGANKQISSLDFCCTLLGEQVPQKGGISPGAKGVLPQKMPLILACEHPPGFCSGIIIAASLRSLMATLVLVCSTARDYEQERMESNLRCLLVRIICSSAFLYRNMQSSIKT